jgi:hypothetical protein
MKNFFFLKTMKNIGHLTKMKEKLDSKKNEMRCLVMQQKQI